jgi:hypothetical protein
MITEQSPIHRRFTSPSYLAHKIRAGGGIASLPGWLVGKVCDEMDGPTRPWRARFRSWAESKLSHRPTQPDTLYAFYDLAVSPVTYDVVTFLCLAEVERQKAGCSKIQVVFVPAASADGFDDSWEKKFNFYGSEEMRWRLHNLLVPCCWLIPTCGGVMVSASRGEADSINRTLAAHRYPPHYTVKTPLAGTSWKSINQAVANGIDVQYVTPSARSLEYVRQWLRRVAGERRVITITLRECSYSPERNSNMPEWLKFAESLDASRYAVIFVRDIEKAFDPMPGGFATFNEAVWNIDMRSAICQLSYVNMSVNNGPNILSWLNRLARIVQFKVVTESVLACSEKFLREQCGILREENLAMANSFQKLVWEEDDFPVISREFHAMAEIIDRHFGADHIPYLAD